MLWLGAFAVACGFLLAVAGATKKRVSDSSRLAGVCVGLILTMPAIRALLVMTTGRIVTSLLVLLLSLVGIIWTITTRRVNRPGMSSLMIVLVGLLLIGGIAFRSQGDAAGSQLAESFLMVLPPIALCLTSKIDWRGIVDGVLLGAVVLLALVVVGGFYLEGRLVVGGENPIWIARVAALGGLAACLRLGVHNLIRLGVLLPMVAIVWESGSRAPFLALLVTALVGGALAVRRRRVVVVLVSVAAVSLLLAQASSVVTGLEFWNGRPESIAERDLLWRSTVDVWWQNPLFGIGRTLDGAGILGLSYPHNFVLELLAQSGVIGGGAFLVLLAVACFRSGPMQLKLMLLCAVSFSLFSGSIWTNYEVWILLTVTCVWSRGAVDRRRLTWQYPRLLRRAAGTHFAGRNAARNGLAGGLHATHRHTRLRLHESFTARTITV